ncbi:leucine-rich repeat-containing protein 56 isoform X1 [Myiozetetes cayanensis]|uniref:leucine-rich repeat-containing protein 56 isoform X1 n=2 Tax=Myiozetetes cayanensis TaxID=478635 RepID=UPI00215F7204|nr:leucine-rich repeat-containing protein 56 isoform X1 [Myiozetetes cayanensis]XP_050192556.1 leucine-rich repeat-containing protein 56 isoform X1 [Myiozetetes cayanensis]XP_050192558.1 leucine-rich repeat-containing protein 56 isoform X1 [Myiozetetes cayanensis]
MDLKWNPDRVSHLGSSEVRVTDWNWRGNRNPNPLIKDDGELLMEEHLSPRKLKALAGVDDLQQVKALEMRVDTRETSLGNFGVHLPNLRELNLNNSLLVSVRDLGTSLSHLCVLWMACCGLSDLDGISSCSSLKELYVAYNNISELSQLTWLDHLEVLDLEGNNIEDIDQMQYLRLCCKLSHLTVEGNLICLKPNAESAEEPGYNYRAEVKKLIPHLKYLDKIPANQTVPLPSKKMYEDCLIIKESIKEGGLAGDISWLDPYLGAVARQSGCGPRPPTTSRPGNAQWSANVGRFSDAQLLYGSRLLPDPAVSDMLFSEDDSSDLTHGLSQVICGNPAKALRERRQKLGPPAASPLELSGLRTENLYGSGGGKDEHQENVSSELRVWREQQKRCLQTGQQEQASQASKVILSCEEEGEGCNLTDSSEDELRKAYDEDLAERISADSSSHSSLSKSSSGSSQTQEGVVFSNPSPCLIPSPPKSPSPASVMSVAARPWKTRNHRVRCLKIPSQEEDRQCTQRCQSRAHQENSAQPLGEELAFLSLHKMLSASGSQGQHQPAGCTSQQRPIPGPTAVGSTRIGPIMDESPSGEINHQHPAVCSSTKASERFEPTCAAWPLTARAVLEPLPDSTTVTRTSQNRSPQP